MKRFNRAGPDWSTGSQFPHFKEMKGDFGPIKTAIFKDKRQKEVHLLVVPVSYRRIPPVVKRGFGSRSKCWASSQAGGTTSLLSQLAQRTKLRDKGGSLRPVIGAGSDNNGWSEEDNFIGGCSDYRCLHVWVLRRGRGERRDGLRGGFVLVRYSFPLDPWYQHSLPSLMW